MGEERTARVMLAATAAPLVTFPLGLLLGGGWVLPALNAAPGYLAMAWLLVRGRRTAAIATVLAWGAALGLVGTVTLALWPSPPDRLVLNGPGYRDEMFSWILTGVGREGSWRAFLPQHVLHLVAFVVLSLATASALSILMGAVLMGYMSFYVAALSRAGVPATTVALFGWQPWAIARVGAFCILGAVLAEPLLSRWGGYRYEGWAAMRRWVAVAAAAILADWVLKAVLAPAWGRTLRAALLS